MSNGVAQATMESPMNSDISMVFPLSKRWQHIIIGAVMGGLIAFLGQYFWLDFEKIKSLPERMAVLETRMTSLEGRMINIEQQIKVADEKLDKIMSRLGI